MLVTDAYLEPTQTSMVRLFVKVVNSYKKKLHKKEKVPS